MVPSDAGSFSRSSRFQRGTLLTSSHVLAAASEKWKEMGMRSRATQGMAVSDAKVRRCQAAREGEGGCAGGLGHVCHRVRVRMEEQAAQREGAGLRRLREPRRVRARRGDLSLRRSRAGGARAATRRASPRRSPRPRETTQAQSSATPGVASAISGRQLNVSRLVEFMCEQSNFNQSVSLNQSEILQSKSSQSYRMQI